MSFPLAFRRHARRTARNTLGIPRQARYSLAWDLLAGICSGAYMGMVFPFATKIARGELHASTTAVALMSAAPFIGNLLSPLWARQMEGRSKMPFVIGSWLAGRFLFFLTPLLAGGAAGFVGIVGGVQFIGTISLPAYTSLMRDIYPDRARGRLMGYVRVGAQTLMFFSTMAAGRLLDGVVSYKVLFPVAGVLGYGAAYAFSRVRPLSAPRLLTLPPPVPRPKELGAVAAAEEKPSVQQFFRETVSILRENEPFRWFAFSVFTYGFGNLMLQPLYALYQVDVLHISGTQIANLTNFASLWSILGSFWWGRFMDRQGAARTVLFSIICVTLIPVVYLTVHVWYGLLFASLLMGFGISGVELSYMGSILASAEPHRTAQYQSLNSLLLGIRGVIAPLVAMPLMRAYGYPKVFIFAMIIMVAGCGMQYLAAQPRRQSKTA